MESSSSVLTQLSFVWEAKVKERVHVSVSIHFLFTMGIRHHTEIWNELVTG